ncbi:MAG: fibrillarin-like rRNA/tRNA 2'-O-methyltransferase [candidate division WOR-3 bacterium]
MKISDHYLTNVKILRDVDRAMPLSPNLVPGNVVYDESLLEIDNIEWRTWDPYRSKFAAGIMNEMRHLPQLVGQRVLYLGAAAGTTPSHFSDVIGTEGWLYGVEVSKRAAKKLYEVGKPRGNFIPIVADAHYPEYYSDVVDGCVDVVYQDISQPDQTEIFIRNVHAFLKPDGIGVLAVKSQSIDSAKKPRQVFREQEEILRNHNFKVIESTSIERFERAHCIIVVQYR